MKINTPLERNKTRQPETQRTLPSENHYVKITNRIIDDAVALRASDIHLEIYYGQKIRIRFRIDGILHLKGGIQYDSYLGMISRIKVLAQMDIAEHRLPQDGNFRYIYEEREIDIRVSTIPTAFGETMVLRILDSRNYLRAIETLGFLPEEVKAVKAMARGKKGLILVTGPTGCGKSTTLYSLLQLRNTEGVNITTVEDPVEIFIPGINQIQVNEKIGITFESALRAILRQDPNIIMMGEIRDEKEAQAAVRAALTGHLVFSTLHTTDALASLGRLQNMGIPGYLLSEVVEGIIAQRLIRKLCPHCKEAYTASPAEGRRLGVSGRLPTLYRAKGCPLCANTGYHDRIGIYEVLKMTEPLRLHLENNVQEKNWHQVETGVTPFKVSLHRHILSGVTSMKEGLQVMGLGD